MTMAFRPARRFRHFSMKNKISALKKVLRKIANPLPMAAPYTKKEA